MPESIRSRVLDLLAEMERRQARDRTRLAGLEAASRRLRRQIEARDHQLRELSSAFGEKFLAEGLTIGTERGILRDDMQASAYDTVAKVPGRPSRAGHPFPKALAAKKITLRQWAEAHKLKRTHVNSWFLDGDGARRIPRKYALEIRKDFGVPLSAWKNGIRED